MLKLWKAVRNASVMLFWALCIAGLATITLPMYWAHGIWLRAVDWYVDISEPVADWIDVAHRLWGRK